MLLRRKEAAHGSRLLLPQPATPTAKCPPETGRSSTDRPMSLLLAHARNTFRVGGAPEITNHVLKSVPDISSARTGHSKFGVAVLNPCLQLLGCKTAAILTWELAFGVLNPEHQSLGPSHAKIFSETCLTADLAWEKNLRSSKRKYPVLMLWFGSYSGPGRTLK